MNPVINEHSCTGCNVGLQYDSSGAEKASFYSKYLTMSEYESCSWGLSFSFLKLRNLGNLPSECGNCLLLRHLQLLAI